MSSCSAVTDPTSAPLPERAYLIRTTRSSRWSWSYWPCSTGSRARAAATCSGVQSAGLASTSRSAPNRSGVMLRSSVLTSIS
ncbi:hypothetical protein [Goodfellowiella coeruleoviolacea]|uniref:hypothetical protein n=1 Tax=Goodfellowiella coeruleoviolacea TaxID=334858 RepID=UPI0020A3BFB4|nr:hypothetical protein [Goodfellowiella coeruleoviolacea]